MPCKITSLFNLVPTNIWKPLKKFVTKDGRDGIIVIDIPFKISTKYTPGLLILLMCLSFANQFVRDIDIDCWDTEIPPFRQKTHSNIDKELNDYCWNYETFLVVRALEPNMRRMVPHPGITQYDKEFDDVITQRYYKFVWLIFATLAVIAFLPYFFWKAKAMKKLKPLVVITDEENYAEDMQRLDFFLETVGFNETFAWFYFGCKVFTCLSSVYQWYLVCGFVGIKFKYYGIDVLTHFLDDTDPWPDPMDIVFPKVAKCDMKRYGMTDNEYNFEVRSTICHMPMNNITQWSFLVYWVWMAVVFVINILSLFHLLCQCFAYCRRCTYQKLVREACRKGLEESRNLIVYVNLSFGDWLVLSFIQQNMEEWKFREFLRQIANTENTVLQLKPIHMSVPVFNSFNKVNFKENQSNADVQNRTTAHTEYNLETQLRDESFAFPNEDQFSIKIKPCVKVDRKHLRKSDGLDKTETPKPIYPEENCDDEISPPNPIYSGENWDDETTLTNAIYPEDNWE